MAPIRFVGINFDHMHMGDNLRMVVENPNSQLAGICDLQPERMEESIARLNIPREQVFTSPEKCLETREGRRCYPLPRLSRTWRVG
jgi:predicted dehydrogenase